jgi:hypothetical protein
MTRPTALTFGEGPNMRTYEEGVYFNMSFEDYLAIPCLSSSGIKNLLVSPTDFWANSWMNPLREDLQTEKQHYEDGKAYHKRILEGREAFYAHYAPAYEDDGDPKMLRTGKDIEAALKGCGAKISGTVMEQAIRLKDADPAARIMHIENAAHKAQYKDRDFISAKLIRYIEYSARLIECDPKINTFFIGGHPEVTILWYDDDYGAWFKIRFDYLKVGPGCDLKTFANIMDIEIQRAVKSAMWGRRYFIQAALYLNGNDVGKRFVAEGKVFGYTGEDRWLKTYSATPCDRFNWVFQKKGTAPVAVGGYITKGSGLHKVGIERVAEAVETYRRNTETFGTDMWITSLEPIHFDHNEMPVYTENL